MSEESYAATTVSKSTAPPQVTPNLIVVYVPNETAGAAVVVVVGAAVVEVVVVGASVVEVVVVGAAVVEVVVVGAAVVEVVVVGAAVVEVVVVVGAGCPIDITMVLELLLTSEISKILVNADEANIILKLNVGSVEGIVPSNVIYTVLKILFTSIFTVNPVGMVPIIL
jgi:hypothetical protein